VVAVNPTLRGKFETFVRHLGEQHHVARAIDPA